MDTLTQLEDNLVTLRMPYIRQHYQDRAKHAVAKGLGHVDYLQMLIDGEAQQRAQRATQRRIRSAHFPYIRTLDTYNFSHPTKIDRMLVQNLFRFQFIRKNANVVFVGTTGLGKTHLAIALAYQGCIDGYKVLYSSATAMVNDLVSAQAQHRLPETLKRYTRPSILLIDELGYLPIDKLGADLLFQVISGRYEQQSTILTTNLIFKNWAQIFAGDVTLTSAALDRLLHHHELIIIEGDSYRMRKPDK
jgi:DNA replication protein DnaC